MTILPLVKPRIALLVALSAGTGHVLATGAITAGLAAPLLGTLLLAAGAGALNQFQERRLDARMERTRLRPIPAGGITPGAALALALFSMAAGAGLLLLLCGTAAASLGLLAAAWYNGLYTPLKRWSRFAAVPGAVIGAIPPAIGWAAAGGSLLAPGLWAVMAFLFLWQVPHFWLLLLIHPGDWRKAGLPSLTARLGPRRLYRITFVWTIATVAAASLLPLFGMLRFLPVYLVLCAAGLTLCFQAARLLQRPEPEPLRLRRLSIGLNAFALMTLICLLVGGGAAP